MPVFKKVNVGDDKAIYAYVREGGGKKIFVILNLSAKEQTIKVTDATYLAIPIMFLWELKNTYKQRMEDRTMGLCGVCVLRA